VEPPLAGEDDSEFLDELRRDLVALDGLSKSELVAVRIGAHSSELINEGLSFNLLSTKKVERFCKLAAVADGDDRDVGTADLLDAPDVLPTSRRNAMNGQ